MKADGMKRTPDWQQGFDSLQVDCSEEITMSKRWGSIEFYCDAPPYPVVQACRQIGLQAPEDVRWCCLDHLTTQPPHLQQVHHGPLWKLFFGNRGPRS